MTIIVIVMSYYDILYNTLLLSSLSLSFLLSLDPNHLCLSRGWHQRLRLPAQALILGKEQGRWAGSRIGRGPRLREACRYVGYCGR